MVVDGSLILLILYICVMFWNECGDWCLGFFLLLLSVGFVLFSLWVNVLVVISLVCNQGAFSFNTSLT